MTSLCPRCGEKYFICGFCNAELESIEAVLLEEDSCMSHYCSSDCIDEDVHLLEERHSGGTSAVQPFPYLIDMKRPIAELRIE